MNPLILPSFDSPSSGVTAWRGNLYPQDVDKIVDKLQDVERWMPQRKGENNYGKPRVFKHLPDEGGRVF